MAGFGNSGGEIALDLAEAGIDVALAVRSPVQIIPRGIDRMTAGVVVFAGGTEEKFDAIILATGFRPDLRRLIPGEDDLFDQQGMPRVTGKPTTVGGLHFCGQITVPTGQLREIGIEARRIVASARAFLKK